MHTPPVIILCQSHLLKVNVKPVAFGDLQDPVACQIVAVVARETRGDDAAVGSIFYHSPTGCCTGRKSERGGRQRVGGVGLDEKSNDTSYGSGFWRGLVGGGNPCLSIDSINIQWTVAGLHSAAHLGLRACDCVCDGLAKSTTAAATLSVQSSCGQPERSAGTGRRAFSSRRRIWSCSPVLIKAAGRMALFRPVPEEYLAVLLITCKHTHLAPNCK